MCARCARRARCAADAFRARVLEIALNLTLILNVSDSEMSTQYEVALYGDFFAKDFKPILNRLTLHSESGEQPPYQTQHFPCS